MKKMLLSLAAVSAVAAAALPAAAQEWRAPSQAGAYGDYGPGDYGRGDHGRDWRPETNWRDGDRRDGSGMRDIDVRQARLESRIERGARHGDITPREAWRLRADAHDLARLEARDRYDGLSRWEFADLSRRLDYLESRVFQERHDGDRYGYGYYR